MILRPASDNAQLMRPVIVNRFPTPALHDSVSLNVFASKVATSAVIVGHSSKDLHIIY